MDTVTRQGIEAILFLADEPVPALAIADVLELPQAEVEAALGELAARYEDDGRGIAIRQVAGGWRMYTAPAARPVLERWALAGRSGRLTQAALETLAVVAYKQPISRQDIGDIRGVNADGAVRSLVARGFIAEVGRDEGPGQALLYGTTPLFLERLGINSLDELPPLTDFLPENPAPDEPELGRLKEIRRQLAAGGELTDPATNTGQDQTRGPDEDDDTLPAPAPPRRRDDGDMDLLTDQLERAARSAVDQLRQAVASQQQDEPTAREQEADDGG